MNNTYQVGIIVGSENPNGNFWHYVNVPKNKINNGLNEWLKKYVEENKEKLVTELNENTRVFISDYRIFENPPLAVSNGE